MLDMKYTSFFILTCVCCSGIVECFSSHGIQPAMPGIRRGIVSYYNEKHHRLQAIELTDPQPLNDIVALPEYNIKEFVDSGLNSFFGTFSARTLGAILGNIAAIAILKYLSDQIMGKIKEMFSPQRMTADIGHKPNIESYVQGQAFESTAKSSTEPSLPPSAWLSLLACIAIDLIGDSSFALPGIGEIEDVVWAPVSAYILSLLFGSNIVAGLDFMKEILPGSDIVPVAIIAWIIKYKYPESPIARSLGISTISSERNKDQELSLLFSFLRSKIQSKKQ